MEMAALVHLSNAVSERAADVAVTALWQGVLVAIALTLCLRMATFFGLWPASAASS